MPNPIAPDNAEELNKLVGNDSTATFERGRGSDDTNGIDRASSENLTAASDTDDLDDEDDDLEDEDEDVEDDDDDDDDEDDELDDEEDEDEDDLDDDDEDEDEEDDAEELTVAPAMRADGLLGYEDEAEDVAAGRTVEQGDAARERSAEKLDDGEADQDDADVERGVDEDDLNHDELDDDRVTDTTVDHAIRLGSFGPTYYPEVRAGI